MSDVFAARLLRAVKRRIVFNIPNVFSQFLQIRALLLSRNKKRVILIGSPAHGNLGDIAIAIAIAELSLFKEKNICLVEFTDYFYQHYCVLIDRFIRPSDPIWIHGGGFIGTLWKGEDDMANHVIETFTKNRIVVLPQTVFFGKGETAAVDNFVRIYGSHPNLTVFMRERNSYELVKNLLFGKSTEVRLVPDMVFRLDTSKVPNLKPSGKVLLCFRSDHERIVNDTEQQKLLQKIQQAGLEYEMISTVLPYSVLRISRKKDLYALLAKVKAARLVIADRLHAMLFAYITETPCIVFDNISRKVSGVYEWIKDCGYVRYCDSFDEDVLCFDLPRGTRKDFSAEFRPLIEELEK